MCAICNAVVQIVPLGAPDASRNCNRQVKYATRSNGQLSLLSLLLFNGMVSP